MTNRNVAVLAGNQAALLQGAHRIADNLDRQPQTLDRLVPTLLRGSSSDKVLELVAGTFESTPDNLRSFAAMIKSAGLAEALSAALISDS